MAWSSWPSLHQSLCLPVFSLDFLTSLPRSFQYLPIAIPFGIMTIIGGINNTESARLAGYDVEGILSAALYCRLGLPDDVGYLFGG